MFIQEELKAIKFAAKRAKNQGEIAVYIKVTELYPTNFSEQQLNIIKFCAEECKRQHSGEMSVYDMVNAWHEAQTYRDVFEGRNLIFTNENKSFIESDKAPIRLDFIEEIGTLVEPIDNAKGFRTIPIGVTDGLGGWIEKSQYGEIPRLLEHLLNSYYEGLLSPEYYVPVPDTDMKYSMQHPYAKTAEDQFYYEFENIHPFRDGNGRTGKILYNYLKGTLDNPVMPPNFFGGSNP